MSDVFYTSDPHFGHEFMAKYRDFSSVEEHDQVIVDSWNQSVTKRDTVWILGDLAMGGLKDWFGPVMQLNGTIHLVFGNHDEGWGGHRNGYKKHQDYLDHGFASVQNFATRKIGDHRVMLSHFPYNGDHYDGDRFDQFRLRDAGLPVLHGHTHNAVDHPVSFSLPGSTQIHVGWDAWQRPVSSNEIVTMLGAE